MPEYKVKKSEIEALRIPKRQEIESELQKREHDKVRDYKGNYKRLKFLNKFLLYQGLARDTANKKANMSR